MPQAIDQLANLPGTQRIVARHVAKPPVVHAGYRFQQLRFKIDHPVTPAVIRCRFAGVEFVRVHGDHGINVGDMLGTAIAKALGTGFDRADAKSLVGVWLKGVTRDMRMIQFNARDLRQMAKSRAVSLINELFRNALHVNSPLGSSRYYQR